MLQGPQSSALFPYTTLFRSAFSGRPAAALAARADAMSAAPGTVIASDELGRPRWPSRSEEHTSELQSREKLVCRLLLEKKKITAPTACNPLTPSSRPRKRSF